MNDDSRMLSTPWPVHWAGWTTTTLDLQGAGWRLAVEFDHQRLNYRLLMKHAKMKLVALTDAQHIERYANNFGSKRFTNYHPSALRPFNVVHVAETLHVERIMSNGSGLSWSKFDEMNAEPMMVHSKIERLEDFNVFATKAVERVFVDKADMSVIEHLEAIKAMQSPKQRELRDRSRQEQTDNAGELVAQLIHLAA